MTNNILLTLITLCIIGIIMACLASVPPSFGSTSMALVDVPMNEIEIEFVPTAHIEVPSNEIEIIFVADK